MSNLIAPAPPPGPRRSGTGPAPTTPTSTASGRQLWALIEALALPGAYIDPSGILAVHRLRQAQEEERHGQALTGPTMSRW